MRYFRLLLEVVGVLALALFSGSFWLGYSKGPRIILPHFAISHEYDAGRLFVQGTWTLEHDEMAWQSQATTIECYRASAACLEATAVIADDFLMPVEINRLKVTSWDREVVVIEGAGSICKTEVYQISTTTNMVTGLVSRRDNANSEVCGIAVAKSRRMRMIDGYATTMAARYGRK